MCHLHLMHLSKILSALVPKTDVSGLHGINKSGVNCFLWDSEVCGRKAKSAGDLGVWTQPCSWFIHPCMLDFERCCCFSKQHHVGLVFFNTKFYLV